ncbi:MAG: PEP-CTERM sorting domain-containing protein, partial [Opitutae bacterium]|nr:PEP-CTERM sorting domain-containing protein [Opitutae bacterium]
VSRVSKNENSNHIHIMNKKIFTTVALIAAGVAFASADTITFDSALTNAGSNTTETYASVWEIAANCNYDTSKIRSDETYMYGGNYAIYNTGNAHYGMISDPAVVTFSTSALYTDSVVADGDTFTLTKLEFLTRAENSEYNTEVTSAYACIYEYSDSTLGSFLGASSSTGTITTASTSDSFGVASYSFTDVELTLGSTYAIVFYDSDGNNVEVGFGQLRPYMSGGSGFDINDTNDWSNVYRLTVATSDVPEPSMFGLLAGLGALGFVAVRRRRNRKA